MTKTKTPVIATNGIGGKKKPGKDTPLGKDAKAYKALQEVVRQHLELIDNELTHYYKVNPHFPRDHAHFFKWTIERTKGHSRVDVFFKENKLPRPKVKNAPAMAMMLSSNGTSSPVPPPSIHTLDETGAPPTGPTEPKKPKSGGVGGGS